VTEPAPRRSRGRRVGRLLGYVGGSACVVAVLAIGVFPTRSFLQQHSDTAQTEHRLAVLRQQNAELRHQLKALNTPEEIERLARSQYNLVKPGEEAYAVLPAPLPPLQVPELWPFGSLQASTDPAGGSATAP
jgi:cell division protein FtsB